MVGSCFFHLPFTYKEQTGDFVAFFCQFASAKKASGPSRLHERPYIHPELSCNETL
jgi:hypothetical protein